MRVAVGMDRQRPWTTPTAHLHLKDQFIRFLGGRLEAARQLEGAAFLVELPRVAATVAPSLWALLVAVSGTSSRVPVIRPAESACLAA